MAALWSRSNLVARLVAKNSSGGRAGGGDLRETSSVAGERRLKLRRSLPSCDGDIDISGLEFDAEGDPPDFLGRQNGCPRAGLPSPAGRYQTESDEAAWCLNRTISLVLAAATRGSEWCADPGSILDAESHRKGTGRPVCVDEDALERASRLDQSKAARRDTIFGTAAFLRRAPTERPRGDIH